MGGEACSCLTPKGDWGDNLLSASEKGHGECVKKLTTKSDIHDKITEFPDRSEFINKAMIVASNRGHSSVLETLISSGGNVNCHDFERKTPLAIAADKGFTDLVKMLINLGAEIDFPDRNDWNALTHATTGGHYDIIEVLLAAGGNVNFVGLRRETALTLAATRGNTGLVKLLLKYGADINHLSIFGNALACASASRSGCSKTVEVLLQAGSDVNSTDHRPWTIRGVTPLMVAAERANIDTMELLLAWGADINQEDDKKETPLHHAAHLSENQTNDQLYNQHYEGRQRNLSVKTLLQYGANIRRKRTGFLELALVKYRIVFSTHSPEFKITEKLSEDGERIVSFLYAAGSPVSEYYRKHKRYGKILPQFIKDDQEHTLALNDLCRRKIRKHLLSRNGGNHNNLIIAVSQLPLPEKLKQYLLFDIDF